MENVLLCVASGEAFAGPVARLLPRSFAEAKAAGLAARLVVLCSNAPEAYVREVEAAGGEPIAVEGDFNDGSKNRHLAMLRAIEGPRLADCGRVLTLDARDTVVLGDPFADWPAKAAVRLSAEGGAMNDDEWNARETILFNRALHDRARTAIPAGWPIVNGGFAGGSRAEMLHFQRLRVAVDVREGPCTDQSSLALLHCLFGREAGFALASMSEPWIFHGHWAQKWSQRLSYADGFRVAIDGRPYSLFHQVDRVPSALAAAIAHFGL